MVSKVVTFCTCDWCGGLIEACPGDRSAGKIAPGVFSLDHVIRHECRHAEDLCVDCIRALRDLRAQRKLSRCQPIGGNATQEGESDDCLSPYPC